MYWTILAVGGAVSGGIIATKMTERKEEKSSEITFKALTTFAVAAAFVVTLLISLIFKFEIGEAPSPDKGIPLIGFTTFLLALVAGLLFRQFRRK